MDFYNFNEYVSIQESNQLNEEQVDEYLQQVCEKHNIDLDNIEDVQRLFVDEGLMGSIFGGLTGLTLGKTIGKIICKTLGIKSGLLYKILTSRKVSTLLGVLIGRKFKR